MQNRELVKLISVTYGYEGGKKGASSHKLDAQEVEKILDKQEARRQYFQEYRDSRILIG